MNVYCLLCTCTCTVTSMVTTCCGFKLTLIIPTTWHLWFTTLCVFILIHSRFTFIVSWPVTFCFVLSILRCHGFPFLFRPQSENVGYWARSGYHTNQLCPAHFRWFQLCYHSKYAAWGTTVIKQRELMLCLTSYFNKKIKWLIGFWIWPLISKESTKQKRCCPTSSLKGKYIEHWKWWWNCFLSMLYSL